MKKVLCPILLLVFLALSCKKKTEGIIPEAEIKADTIKPDPYFPAFPGSYWKYVNSNNDTITYTTSAAYEKDSYQDRDSDGNILKSGSSYVPRYNNVPIWGGYVHSGPIYNYNYVAARSLIPIISGEFAVGFSWTTYAVGHEGRNSRILKKDTSIEVWGKSYYPTIVVYSTGSYASTVGVPLSRKYYTKDIGLVKEETLNASNGNVASEMHLVNYHINK